jgi:DNA-binding NarL/FixJ family response regulator
MKIHRIGLLLKNEPLQDKLSTYLKEQNSFELIWKHQQFDEVIQIEQAPDIILLEEPEQGNVLDIVKSLKENFRDADVIVLVNQYDPNLVFRMIYAGISSILLKDSELKTLINSIISTSKGGSYLSPSIARIVVDYFSGLKPEKLPIFRPTP